MFEQSTPVVVFKHQSQGGETGTFAIHSRAGTRLFPALTLFIVHFMNKIKDNFILLLSVSPG